MKDQPETEPPTHGVHVRSGNFSVVRTVIAGLGSKPIYLGTPATCRFCATTVPTKFRKEAHTIPEALGNKWLFSMDECDDCNNGFSRYEGALAASVGAFLTLGGVKGKTNSVRQTGRTAGPTHVRHELREGHRCLSAMVNGLETALGRDPVTGAMVFRLPIANERFRPLHAHKALLKMGYALLPDSERQQYEGLRVALLNPAMPIGEAPQSVGLAFAMVGNAPPLVSAALLRSHEPGLPRTLVVVTAGSVCMIAQLRSDDSERETVPLSSVGLTWTTQLRSNEGGQGIAIRYSPPLYFDWSSAASVVQPVEMITLEFDPATRNATLTPSFRTT